MLRNPSSDEVGSPQLLMMQEGESLVVPIEPWPQREPVCQAHASWLRGRMERETTSLHHDGSGRILAVLVMP
jgi:hypothetical protein